MKANRFAQMRWNDERAEVGIGTLIVFIAAVLVAAVAAAVLINSSTQVQERAQSTGRETTQQVASNLLLYSVHASRPATTGDMEHLNITIGLAAGSFPVDLAKSNVTLTSSDQVKHLGYINGAQTNGKFNATGIRDSDNSWTAANPTMTGDDLVQVWIDLRSTINNLPLAPGEKLGVKITPERGTPLLADIVMPSSYGADKVIQVR